MSFPLLSRRTALLTPSWARNELWRRARAVPSLDLRFAESKSLVDATTGANLVTFTRSSTGTYIDSDGLIKTAATNEARFDHNPTTGESLGLLVEEQRTNLLLNSETLSTQDVTTAAAARTLSFYGTGTVTLSGAHSATVVGNGAYPARTTLTFTPTAGTLTVTVSGTVQYANLETGSGGAAASFATSWIPTTNATATRSADVASITGPAFSSWYRQDEGTVFVDVASIYNGARYFMFDDGTTVDRWEARYSSYVASINSWKASVQDVNSNTNVIGGTPSTNVKIAATNKTNDAAITSNGTGAILGTDTSCTMPAGQTRLWIGSFQGTASYLNGPIRRLTYWPQRLPNSTLQAITL